MSAAARATKVVDVAGAVALREALDAFMNALMPTVTGDVTLKLFKGASSVVGRTSPFALYSTSLASFDMRGYTPAELRDVVGVHRVEVPEPARPVRSCRIQPGLGGRLPKLLGQWVAP